MALFKLCRGNEINLPSTLTNGYAYFCTDTGNFYIDHLDSGDALVRSKISANYADKLRYTSDGSEVEIDPSNILTSDNYETVIGLATTENAGLMSSEDKAKLDEEATKGCFVDTESEMAGLTSYDNAIRCIIAPTTAEVGQTIVVSAVDENGRPTEWALVNVSDMVTESDKTEIAESAAALVDNELLSVIGEVSA